MARPRKTGLDYFSLDVDFDEKVDAIEIQFGNDGFAVFVKSLQSCYKTEDGEFDCSEVFRRTTAAKRANVSVERWLEIVQYAADIGLFSKKDWDERKVITSQGIKKRIDAVSADRKAARLRKEASRHSPSPTPPPLKAKKRKVKESKGNPRYPAKHRSYSANNSRTIPRRGELPRSLSFLTTHPCLQSSAGTFRVLTRSNGSHSSSKWGSPTRPEDSQCS